MTMEGARSGKYSESRKERACWTKRVACRLVLWPILEPQSLGLRTLFRSAQYQEMPGK